MQQPSAISNHPGLDLAIRQFLSKTQAVVMASLATVDGFNILTLEADQKHLEHDMISAISSSLFALAKASAKQIADEDPQITSVETSSGILLFISTDYSNQPCVLTVYARGQTTIGALRYAAIKLSDHIKQIGESLSYRYAVDD